MYFLWSIQNTRHTSNLGSILNKISILFSMVVDHWCLSSGEFYFHTLKIVSLWLKDLSCHQINQILLLQREKIWNRNYCHSQIIICTLEHLGLWYTDPSHAVAITIKNFCSVTSLLITKCNAHQIVQCDLDKEDNSVILSSQVRSVTKST